MSQVCRMCGVDHSKHPCVPMGEDGVCEICYEGVRDGKKLFRIVGVIDVKIWGDEAEKVERLFKQQAETFENDWLFLHTELAKDVVELHLEGTTFKEPTPNA